MRKISDDLAKRLVEHVKFYAKAVVTFADGSSVTLSGDDFYDGNMCVQSAEASSFPFGCIIAKSITLLLVNDDYRWDNYYFTGANIALYSQYIDDDDDFTEETYLGSYTVVTPETYGTTVEITAVDNSYKLDKEFTADIDFPLPASELLAELASFCGITYSKPSRYDRIQSFKVYSIDDNATCRQILEAICGIYGGNGMFDSMNNFKFLEYDKDADSFLYGGIFDEVTEPPYKTGDEADGGDFTWAQTYSYDGGSFASFLFTLRPDNMSLSSSVNTDPVTISGVTLSVSDTYKASGSTEDGYVLSISSVLAGSIGKSYVDHIGEIMIGFSFVPFTADTFSDPRYEAGDNIYIYGRDGEPKYSVITDSTFNFSGYSTIKCSGDTATHTQQKYVSKSETELNYAISSVKESANTNSTEMIKLMSNGMGLHFTEEKTATGGSIYYLHTDESLTKSQYQWRIDGTSFMVSTDYGKTWANGFDANGNAVLNNLSVTGFKFDWAKGGELSLGGSNNGYGSLYVFGSDGALDTSITNAMIKSYSDLYTCTVGTARVTMSRKKSFASNDYDDMGYIGNVNTRLADDDTRYGIDIVGNTNTTDSNAWNGKPVAVIGNRKSDSFQENAVFCYDVFTYYINSPFSGATINAGAKNKIVGRTVVVGNLYVDGNIIAGDSLYSQKLTVRGDKTRVIETESYGVKPLYAYETPTPYFGDIGFGETDENGECVIDIDPIFLETVAGTEYHVFLQKYGPGDLYVSERSASYFIVKGTANTRFSWEVKEAQIDLETNRWSDVIPEEKTDGIDYEQQYEEEYTNLIKELEETR